MSLQDLYTQTAQDFNPKTDKINDSGFEKLPAGEYLVSVDVAHYASKSGFLALAVDCQVIDGDHAGQKELVFINLSETKKDGTPVHEMVLSKNMKMLQTIASLTNTQLTPDMFAGNLGTVYMNLENAFRPNKGKLVKMHKETYEYTNKQGEQKEGENYEFSEAQQNPMAQQPTFNEADLPF